MKEATSIKGKTKKCARKTCLKTKPIDQFPSDKREHDKHSVWCKSCWAEYQAARKAKIASGTGKKTMKKAPAKVAAPKAVKKVSKEVN